MANIKSIGGNPIVLGLDGLSDEVTHGYNPSLSVGRADALTGANSTAQWAQRTSEGSGSATVRSVKGNTVVWNQMNDNARSSGTNHNVTFTKNNDGTWTVDGTADGDAVKEICSIPRVNGDKYLVHGCPTGGGLSAYYVNIAGGSASGDFGSGYIYTAPTYTTTALYITVKDGVTVNNLTFIPQVFDLTQMFGSGNEPSTVAEFEAIYPEAYYPYSAPTLKPVQIAGIASTDAQGGELDAIEWTAQTLRAAGSVADVLYSDHVDVRVGERAYQSGDESDATVRTDGTTTYYPLATPTTTPISPALPMTYRVQQGGTEAIIVPDGEVSAAPIITVAEGEDAATVVMDALACIATPDGPTATANHAINTYLTMGGKLYKVTTAIAAGESIVAGTNVTETTVMAELIARTA